MRITKQTQRSKRRKQHYSRSYSRWLWEVSDGTRRTCWLKRMQFLLQELEGRSRGGSWRKHRKPQIWCISMTHA